MTLVLSKSRAFGAANKHRATAGIAAAGLALTLLLGSSAPADADAVGEPFPFDRDVGSIALNPVTDTVYVTSSGALYGVSEDGTRGVPGLRHIPGALFINSATNKIYVTGTNKTMEENYVSVVDETTHTVTLIPFNSYPRGMAVNEVSNKVYVATNDGVTVIDGATNAATAVPNSTPSGEIAVNTSSNKAYAVADNTVSVINPAGQISSTVTLDAQRVLGLAVNPAKNKIYAVTASDASSSIVVIDGATDTIVTSLAWDSPIETFALNPATDKLYIGSGATTAGGSVRVVDGATLKESARIDTPTRVKKIVVNPANNKIYASMAERGTTIIDGQNNRSTALYTHSWDKALVNPSNNKVYTVLESSVKIIDGNKNAPVKNDFNGDGKTDVIARDSSGNLWLYPGNGAGGWLPQRLVGQGWNVMTAMLAPGDFNGDGTMDLLARDGGGVLWLYPGNGSAGWYPRVQVGTGWQGMTTIEGIGDYSGDGFVDIAARSIDGVMWLYQSNGTGGWRPGVTVIGSGWNAMSEITGAGDFNSDGVADVLARDAAGALWIYPPTGNYGWLPRRQTGAGWNAMNSLVGPGDFDGDGKSDILARDGAGNLWLYQGSGGSAWPTAKQVGAGWNIMTAIL